MERNHKRWWSWWKTNTFFKGLNVLLYFKNKWKVFIVFFLFRWEKKLLVSVARKFLGRTIRKKGLRSDRDSTIKKKTMDPIMPQVQYTPETKERINKGEVSTNLKWFSFYSKHKIWKFWIHFYPPFIHIVILINIMPNCSYDVTSVFVLHISWRIPGYIYSMGFIFGFNWTFVCF